MLRFNPHARSHKVRLGDRVAVRARRDIVVVQVEIRFWIHLISYLTLPEGERRWDRM